MGKKDSIHRSWDELSKFYQTMHVRGPNLQNAVNSLADLCEIISKSSAKDALFGHTSISQLRIAQIETVYPPHPTIQWLVADPQSDGRITLRFEQGRNVNERWSKTIEANELLPAFNSTLRQLGWLYHPIAD